MPQTAPGVFLLTLGLLFVILLVGLTSLSATGGVSSTETNYGAVALVFAGLFGIAFFASRRRRK